MKERDMAIFAAKNLDDKKAIDTVVLSIGEKSSFADYMILASGTSTRHIDTLCDNLEEKFEKEGIFARHIEGKKESGWLLMDYGDIIVNILTTEMREKYNIEKVWGDCDFLNLEDEHEREV